MNPNFIIMNQVTSEYYAQFNSKGANGRVVS